jgi:hypothetical protein
MDDERIKQLTQEVLADLVRPVEPDHSGATDLETRIASLEAEVRGLRGGAPAGTAGPVVTAAVVVSSERPSHPSFTLLDLGPGSRHCVMEPDKPCVQSGACRTFGH